MKLNNAEEASATFSCTIRNWATRLLSSRSITLTIIVIIGANLVSALWTAIYNLYFHPLRKYPGPKFWIAFPLRTDIARFQGNTDFKIREFHEQFGDVVRIGPNTLSFTSPDAWKDIYGHGHPELPKGHDAVDGDTHIIVANAPDHFRFRRAMLPAFSDKALGRQESLMKVYVDLLIERLREVARSEQPTDMVHWYMLTTFDLIGDLAYGESFDGLKEGKTNQWLANIEMALRLIPIISLAAASPLLSKLMMFMASGKLKKAQESHRQMATDLAMKRINNKDLEERGDFMTHFLRSRGQAHGLTDKELSSNTDILMVAGSETTATLLSGVTYFLLSNPDAYVKCVAEVRQSFTSEDDISFRSATAKLPYMLACLDEALRLFPPVPSLLQRRTLPGSLTPVSGCMVPENTLVGVHHLSAYHSSRNFHRAKEFLPERWLLTAQKDPSSPFFNDKREVHKPFSFGPRDCIGRNLAYHEMRLIMTKLLWNFDMELGPRSNGWVEAQRAFILWEKSPLMLWDEST
ncbi:putative benzoate 4-monooxygenase cytochrome p450 protein [Neofusicoccum parvum UCRNP2]|uniref:Putative benzoate 4-monooxygenase cytochrome p450 protein n=1 Tax=Botryosphaeria parva (strain UCR-NP2) TaxID=1287680 RepID=R1FVH4_BOTPV|nr:putative benzoate 4-monooxygenase cytochrome p450 protein [Neofusicoccum parvum UCRNP2]